MLFLLEKVQFRRVSYRGLPSDNVYIYCISEIRILDACDVFPQEVRCRRAAQIQCCTICDTRIPESIR